MLKFVIDALAAGAIATGVLLVIKKGSPTWVTLAVAGAVGHVAAHTLLGGTH